MKLTDVLKSDTHGLFYGNRIILPFRSHFLKVIIDKNIITDFSPFAKGIFIREKEDFTDIYFNDYSNLKDAVSQFEAIKMVVVEKGDDIFNFKNHKKLAVYLLDNHKIKIEETDDDIIFIE